VPDFKLLNGTDVQGWTLTRILGSGADGIVYAGTKNDAEVAIKLFFPESLAKNGVPEARERLELQLALIGKKHHPNLVEVFAGGEDDELGTMFIVMELVHGTSLDKIIEKVPPDAIPRLVKQLASAAKFLESQDLFHRDIKPANIVISDDFQKLTLLDLGVVYQLPTDDDNGRLSGMEFVATLRYSPPEFVWRTEQSNDEGAWRAVTFYQIGATVHDMIMRKPLFAGHDQPRACLYDCVKDHTPVIKSDTTDKWLIQVAQACLLKDWRQRLHLVNWDSFDSPVAGTNPVQQEIAIRLRQIRKEEVRRAAARKGSVAPAPTREQELWQLNSALFLETRTYLLDSAVFPRFTVTETRPSEHEYISRYEFEKDIARDFTAILVVSIGLKVAPLVQLATELSFDATVDGTPIQNAVWTEMFTVEEAFSRCRQALLDTVELLVPKE
jgi:serine/threonine protein kinase